MSAVNGTRKLAGKLRRRHLLNKEEVDRLGWPHPRPAADPRLICLHLAFIWTSVAQIIKGPPPTTVQAISFGYSATVFWSSIQIACCVMLIYAAYCKSQYNSFGVEVGATVGFTGVFTIYSVAAMMGLNEWYATSIAPVAVLLAIGNGIRAGKLLWRLW